MVKGAAKGCYEPGPSFKEVNEKAKLDISPTESQEFWLIQWPYKDNTLSVSDFHGKNLSLSLHKDGNMGVLESSSGKSFELVSFASQQPDATVFLPSESETRAVGKISRRVCLVRYPNPEELEKPNVSSLTPSIMKSSGTYRKSKSRITGFPKNHSSQGSALSLGATSVEPTSKHKKMKDGSSLGHSNMTSKASEGSHARGAEKSKKKVRIAE